jgi:hypothetical protein
MLSSIRLKGIRTTGKEYSLGIDAQCVDDRIVTTEIMHKCAFRAFPLLNVVASR